MILLRNIGFLFLLFSLLFSACRKDEDVFGSLTPEVPTPEIIVNGSFSGVVTNELNEGIENAAIRVGVHSTMSDANGFFSFENVEINTQGSLVTVEKFGDVNIKFVKAKLNEQSFVQLQLVKDNYVGTFPSVLGGAFTANDGTSITIDGGKVEYEFGYPSIGECDIYMSWLDPLSSDLAQRMPGDLRAINTDNEQQQLTTYGMISFYLTDEAGSALYITEGETATIRMPVPAALQATAPSRIPLWYFDESTGYWMEEGTAILQGDKYVGTVGHSSVWNCGLPNEIIQTEGAISIQTGNSGENLTVVMREVSSAICGYGWTDESGQYVGALPKNKELSINILDNCGTEIYSEQIGPFAEDAIIPEISLPSEDFIRLSGELVDCDGNPVPLGYLKVEFADDYVILTADSNGMFNEVVSRCAVATIDVTGYDMENIVQSTTLTETITGTAQLDLGAISICE